MQGVSCFLSELAVRQRAFGSMRNRPVFDRCTVVDIICHGAPSPLLWREYVTHLECIHKGKVTNLTFKDKRNGWLRPTACVKIFNKEISIADYVRFFFSDVPLRPSCYQCPFAKIERETDMTIGDFWHIEEKKPEFYDSEGNSLLLIHTEKGSAFLSSARIHCKSNEVQLMNVGS